MNVPFFDLKRQYKNIQQEIDNVIKGTFERTEFVHGKSVENFENQFATYNGVKYCACVTNGTIALHLALLSMGVSSGDEAIVPVNTFIATAEAVSHCGATPVFVDVNKDDYTIDIDLFEKAITKHTKVVIPVHLYGHPANMNDILKISLKYDINVLEDCAQSHGATVDNKKVGSFGIMSAFSFYPSKNLGAYGEGGAILTNNEQLYLLVRKLKDHGSIKKYEHDIIGYNYRISGLQGPILSIKLKYLDEWNKRRIEIANRYRDKLDGLNIKLPMCQSGMEHVYHLFVVQIENREKNIDLLKQKNVGFGIHYPIPLHLTRAYQYLGYKVGDFPVAEEVSKKIISLPMFPELTNDEVDYVCEVLKKIL
jgi:dTDP-4-amino-4,6-dideoxygalactose transaminase